MSSTCPHNTANIGPLAAEIDPVVWDTPAYSTGFASWQRYCTASSTGRQPNFAALNRGCHLCSAGRPSCWALAHILVGCIHCCFMNKNCWTTTNSSWSTLLMKWTFSDAFTNNLWSSTLNCIPQRAISCSPGSTLARYTRLTYLVITSDYCRTE